MKLPAAIVAAAIVLSANCCLAQGTPKETGIAFAKAIASGDAPAARSLSIADENDGKLLEALSWMIVSMKHLQTCAIGQFGEEEGKMVAGKDPGEEMVRSFSESLEKIEGDSATLTIRNDKQPVTLKKVDDKWKIDMSTLPDRKEIDQAMPMFQALARTASELSTEIAGGKYKNANQAKQALGMRVMAVTMGQAAAASQPAATQPSTKASP